MAMEIVRTLLQGEIIMIIDHMTLEDVEKRLSELDDIVTRTNKLEVVNDCTKEKKELLARKKELSDMFERRETAQKITDGSISDYKILETRSGIKETKNMEDNKIGLLKRYTTLLIIHLIHQMFHLLR